MPAVSSSAHRTLRTHNNRRKEGEGLKRDLKGLKNNKDRGMSQKDLEDMMRNPKPDMINNFDPNLVSNVQDAVSHYSKKSEGELFDELKKMTGEQKKAGKLSNADIENTAARIAPMLTAEQQKKMQSILKKLKD
jgi:hypothetical protein